VNGLAWMNEINPFVSVKHGGVFLNRFNLALGY